mmetsp:Transcript_31249/g.46207  ORF Transcript_31249/g.46207 Transcript_31249/m.46207 type:complete len:84 (-) Transcript_31249:111-362(-)|eukprot:CAMPEP_0195514292 /NCGR_PEP_ID=MMETSP0794_2-20130614/5726_1 /TAXON_ID=515487 /ORGANISM="Stephanopyxis turris, Strain CCMP 815" /LENGTH=83 /DNA_ID=CAMNT_0040642509 /DNA_START=159 /DNA_END=410 /DNA_ORIENTATION=+
MSSPASNQKSVEGENENRKVEQQEPSITEAIEEDDEFEEFIPCAWDASDEDAEDGNQWQDNWDDDDIDDDFTKTLRVELTSTR